MVVHLKSQNVRGLGDFKKRREIFHSFHLSKYEIFLLQETHSSLEHEIQWKNEWGGEIFFSHGSTNSRGVCILLKNNFTRTVHGSQTDGEGRYIILDIEIDSLRLLICNIYGPNQDHPIFYVNLITAIETYENANYIIGGDWNFVLNLDKDKKGGVQQTNATSRDVVLTFMEEFDLIDIWRHANPEEFKFTWKRIRPPPGIFCRLDFFLVSFGLADKIEKTDIVPGYKSDHSAITLSLLSLTHGKGPSYWKLNCSYLKDEDFITGIKDTISDTVNCNRNTDPILLWDTIKCQIRGFALRFTSRKKHSRDNIIQALEKRLIYLENSFSKSHSNETEEQILLVKEELEKVIEEKTKGAMIRSRCRWFEEGEKPTRYFLNLEKRNYNNKNLDRLMLENGDIVENPDAILDLQRAFYKKLYTTTITENDGEPTIPEFLKDFQDINNIPKISEETKVNWEHAITEHELLGAMNSTQNGKSPGLDGLPIEFYKSFWTDIKEYFMKAIESSYQQNRLSISQCQGVISLIPKKEKNPLLLKNWRPISLLNVDYKIVAKAIAIRIKSCLEGIINRDQTGFMKNRYIGENIVKALSIIEYAEEEDIPALLMFVDYEKAFDTIEWTFVDECLRFFNFSDVIIKWFRILYKNISSYVINNGWISESFMPSRGVRQGCPLSPYLFIISAEIFAIAIRNNNKIKGIDINGKKSKIEQYADDTFMAFLFDQESLDEILYTLDKFQVISGLKVNYDKTEILRIGSLKNSEAQLYTQRNLTWTNNPSILLGIEISTDIQNIVTNNYDKVIKRIENLIKLWKGRQLTIFGRTVVIKTLLVSQLIYRFSVLPSPSVQQMKHINNLLINYLWGEKKHFIDKDIVINNLSEGGLTMVDISSKDVAVKCSWVRRLTDDSPGFWKELVEYFIPNSKKLFWSGNLKVSDGIKLMKHNSIFWRNIVRSWCIYNFFTPTSIEEILNQQLWYNSFILVGGQPIYKKSLHTKGISLLRDIVNEDGNIMSIEQIVNKYQLDNQHVMLLNSIVAAVPQAWKTQLGVQNQPIEGNGRNHSKFQTAVNNSNISKFVYQNILSKKSKPFKDKTVEKWLADIGENYGIDRDFLSNCFNLIIKSTISPKHRAFQFKLLHRILVTNKMLNEWKLKDSNSCTFCNLEPETLYHMLWGCNKVQDLWKKLFDWLNEITGIIIPFHIKEVLLGILDEHLMVYNTIFIIAKQFIYSNRCHNRSLYIDSLKRNIKYYYKVEKYIATKNNKLNYHNNKWSLMQW